MLMTRWHGQNLVIVFVTPPIRQCGVQGIRDHQRGAQIYNRRASIFCYIDLAASCGDIPQTLSPRSADKLPEKPRILGEAAAVGEGVGSAGARDGSDFQWTGEGQPQHRRSRRRASRLWRYQTERAVPLADRHLMPGI
jgi:hypothetical protein